MLGKNLVFIFDTTKTNDSLFELKLHSYIFSASEYKNFIISNIQNESENGSPFSLSIIFISASRSSICGNGYYIPANSPHVFS